MKPNVDQTGCSFSFSVVSFIGNLFLLILALLMIGSSSYVQADEFLFDGVFLNSGEEPVITDTSYTSENIRIEISSRRENNSDVYIADVYIRSMDCFCRSYGDGFSKSNIMVKKHLASFGGILGVTGDSSAKITAGIVMGNGDVWRNTVNRKRDLCIVYRDGTVDCLLKSEVADNGIYDDQEGVLHIFLFGPSLLDDDGNALEAFTNNGVESNNPRTVFGYYEPGHYCFVVIDGRKSRSALEEGKRNRGFTMKETASLMASLGCKAAYNLDGGKSAMMVFNDELVDTPPGGGRPVYDAIIIREPNL